MDVKSLIQLVRNYEELYNIYNSEFNNLHHKDRIWKIIGEQLNVEGSECKRRWGSLKDQLRKILKNDNKKIKHGRIRKKTKKWKYYDSMLFIAPYFKGMENVDNVKDPLDCREIKDEEGNSMDDTFEISSEEDVSAVPKVENVFNTSQQVSVERTASSMLMESMFDKKEEPMSFSNHPIDMFFNALAAIVKAFPPHHQHKAKSQIFSVISDIEWQYLQESHGYPERENQSSNQISSSNIKNDSIDKTTLPCILKVTGSADIPNS